MSDYNENDIWNKYALSSRLNESKLILTNFKVFSLV